MCSVLLGYQPGATWLAANRDELYARAARPPFWWPQGFLAGRDEVAGGTWLGLNRSGLMVAVTNRFGATRHGDRGSRGTLVTESLGFANASELHAHLAAMDPHRCNAFHLLYADQQRAGLTWSDGERIEHTWLEPGLHVVTERSFGAADGERERRLRDGLGNSAKRPSVETLQRLLATHVEGDPAASSCVHLESFGYGTRSSAVLFPNDGFWWAEGRPCTTPWRDLTPLLRG